MKMLILGVGFLAQFLIPCYERMLGDDLSDKVIGIKATDRNLEAVRARCPFPVQVKGAREALDAFHPDLILIGVRPQQVVALVQDTLKPYFDALRQRGEPLPIIYSLAPDPTVDYYWDALGGGVRAAYQFPNVVREVAGVDVSRVGVSFVTFDARAEWSPEDREAALRFLEPTGEVFELEAAQASPFLAVQPTSHLIFSMIYLIQDAMAAHGRQISAAALASAICAELRPHLPEACADLIPCDSEGVEGSLRDVLRRLTLAWCDGLMDFVRSEGLPEAAGMRNICGTLASYCMQAQMESREAVERTTADHATPGGYLELALRRFDEFGAADLSRAMDDFLSGRAPADFEARIRRMAFDIIRAVSEHGKALGGVKKA